MRGQRPYSEQDIEALAEALARVTDPKIPTTTQEAEDRAFKAALARAESHALTLVTEDIDNGWLKEREGFVEESIPKKKPWWVFWAR